MVSGEESGSVGTSVSSASPVTSAECGSCIGSVRCDLPGMSSVAGSLSAPVS